MVRKRIITLGLVLGLAVNQIMLYQARTIAAEDYNVPQFLLNDMQKNVGTNNTINNSQVQPAQFQQPVQMQNNYRYEQANNYDPNRPEWSEFCPYGLENITTKDDAFHLWATNSRYEADNRNYWVDRRKDFEKHLAQCDSVQDTNARYGCYAKLRQRQQRITENYVDPWQQAAIRQQKFAAWSQAMTNVQNQINANAAAQREYNLRQQEMWVNYFNNSSFKQQNNSIVQPKYNFYDRYGRPLGYVQQSNW